MEKHPSFTGNSSRKKGPFSPFGVGLGEVGGWLPIAGFTIVCPFGVPKIGDNHPFLGHVSPILWNIHGTYIYIYIYVCIHIHITCRYLGRPSWLFFGRFFSSRFKGLFSQQLGLGECHFAGIGLNHIYIRFVDLLICILINKTHIGFHAMLKSHVFFFLPGFCEWIKIKVSPPIIQGGFPGEVSILSN